MPDGGGRVAVRRKRNTDCSRRCWTRSTTAVTSDRSPTTANRSLSTFDCHSSRSSDSMKPTAVSRSNSTSIWYCANSGRVRLKNLDSDTYVNRIRVANRIQQWRHVASETGFKQNSPNSNPDSDSLIKCSFTVYVGTCIIIYLKCILKFEPRRSWPASSYWILWRDVCCCCCCRAGETSILCGRRAIMEMCSAFTLKRLQRRESGFRTSRFSMRKNYLTDAFRPILPMKSSSRCGVVQTGKNGNTAGLMCDQVYLA